MTELIVDDRIAEQLRQLALQENRPLDAVLHSLLESYTTSLQPSEWPLEMARMAERDTDIVWAMDAPDLSERSRDILENEFEAYLLKRLSDDGADSA